MIKMIYLNFQMDWKGYLHYSCEVKTILLLKKTPKKLSRIIIYILVTKKIKEKFFPRSKIKKYMIVFYLYSSLIILLIVICR